MEITDDHVEWAVVDRLSKLLGEDHADMRKMGKKLAARFCESMARDNYLKDDVIKGNGVLESAAA